MTATVDELATIATEDLAETFGGQDYPGFTRCGPNYFSKGCVDGGMSYPEWDAIARGSKMVDGSGKATFGAWAGWMRRNGYPSRALDRIGR